MAATPSHYWHAQGLARSLREAFVSAQARGDRAAMRESFYHLAYFETRTLAMLRAALEGHREPLARATMHNLIALHTTLRSMHHEAPEVISSTVNHLREARLHLIDDLIVEWLEESSAPVAAGALARRIGETHLLAGMGEPLLRLHLDDLVAGGYIVAAGDGFMRSRRPFHADNFDELGLHALLTRPLARELAAAGFHGLLDVAARRGEFRSVFRAVTGYGDDTAALLVSAAAVLEEPEVTTALSPWPHADLIHSPHPRPYQHEAYAALRGHGYHGQVIEAPAGSGKTLIGMMCVQDWLRTLTLGEAVLVLVPTINYERQWLDELCIAPAGLRLPASLVHAGPPADLAAARARSGISPCVLVMTYAALSRLASAPGTGGIDQGAVETFLQSNSIRYIILDEVHKVVEDPRGIATGVARVFVDRLAGGSLRGLIGLSGTVTPYRERLHELGLALALTVPAHELIAHGYVAPFAECGVPFAYSAREQRIRDLLDAYKARACSFAALLGSATLRRWFASIPMPARVRVARDLLGMYRGRADRDPAIARRLAGWETGDELALAELPLISLVQVIKAWSDERLLDEACADRPAPDLECTRATFTRLLDELASIRAELRALIRHADLARRLELERFGTWIDDGALGRLLDEGGPVRGRLARVKDALAPTIVGLYAGLREWYGRTGEGRVDTIRAVIEAERAARPVQGVIVFDAAQRLVRQRGLASAGYRGVAGAFAALLGDPDITPVAVLSGEMYLPHDAHRPLTTQIAAYIRRAVMAGELPAALFALLTDRLALSDAERQAVRSAFGAAITRYTNQLGTVKAARPVEFSRAVLAPVRRAVRRIVGGPARAALVARLTLQHHHTRAWIGAYFDYALVAASFERARTTVLECADGGTASIAVITMPSGRRRQLVYELTARMMDAEELPINLAIVSSWARTGWNVIRPNVLVDATATRDPIAWQQLRGRAMRPLPSWTADCHRLMSSLIDGGAPGLPARSCPAEAAGTAGSAEERRRTAIALLTERNKVTHIYELVRACGSGAQLRWDGAARRWRRTPSIADKHRHEAAISPLGGLLVTGPAHAPLVYADDPRHDHPATLRSRLESLLRDRDPVIVAGWLDAARSAGATMLEPACGAPEFA